MALHNLTTPVMAVVAVDAVVAATLVAGLGGLAPTAQKTLGVCAVAWSPSYWYRMSRLALPSFTRTLTTLALPLKTAHAKAVYPFELV